METVGLGHESALSPMNLKVVGIRSVYEGDLRSIAATGFFSTEAAGNNHGLPRNKPCLGRVHKK